MACWACSCIATELFSYVLIVNHAVLPSAPGLFRRPAEHSPLAANLYGVASPLGTCLNRFCSYVLDLRWPSVISHLRGLPALRPESRVRLAVTVTEKNLSRNCPCKTIHVCRSAWFLPLSLIILFAPSFFASVASSANASILLRIQTMVHRPVGFAHAMLRQPSPPPA